MNADKTKTRRPLIVEVIQSPRRWMVKHFRSQEAQTKWIGENQHQLQIVPLFVNNGYAVEFRKLLTNAERLERQGEIFNHNGKCGKIITQTNKKQNL